MIEPVFEELAQTKGQVAFVKVDLGVGMGSMVAREYGVTATPTFGFFLDGKKVRCLWARSFIFLWG
jgi:thiol-disulfide isomerase/thioredoxin